MSLANNTPELFKGFSKLNREQRFNRLQKMGALSKDDIKYLKSGANPEIALAEKFIENVIGYFQLPLGIAANLRIDGNDYAIPMAVEETSIIAALSKTARWIRDHGSINTKTLSNDIIGQIQLAVVNEFPKFAKKITENKDYLINLANEQVAQGLVKRGGGVNDLQIRSIKRNDGKIMAVLHILADPCDAMGANIMNQVCEYLKAPIEKLTGESVSMCILSNLNDKKLTQAKIIIRDIDPILGNNLEEASLFAELDPYRAATHNKGILNGMDPLLIATGNDWRAVEAGVHAYAARSGTYSALSQWRMQGTSLVGELTAPIVVGTVGGVTKLHPTAKMCLQMMNIESANHLAQIVCAVGLVQNLGAMRALVTEGIIEGHMKLHIKNLSLNAGANDKEMPILEKRLEELLMLQKRVSLSHALELLQNLRLENASSG